MSTRKIIRQIAKNNGVTPQQVKKDISTAIKMGMSSTNPTAIAAWKQISPSGSEPSVDTFLKICINKLNHTINANQTLTEP